MIRSIQYNMLNDMTSMHVSVDNAVSCLCSTKRLNELRMSRDFDFTMEKESDQLDFEKETPLKIISEDDLPKSQSINHEKRESPDMSEREGKEKKVVNSNSVRSGASSPSLSVGMYLESRCAFNSNCVF